MIHTNMIYCFLFLCMYTLLNGCSSSAVSQFQRSTQSHGLSRTAIPSQPISTQFYTSLETIHTLKSKAPQESSLANIHVYIGSDGTPWIDGRYPAKNPTAKTSLALQLMLQDPNPSLYLSRPCYDTQKRPTLCTTQLWTQGRYSATIINSMHNALDFIKNHLNIDSFLLIGHSGGASIATILASTRKDINGLVTIAANIDHKQWTQHLHYWPLEQSLNPIDYLPIPQHIKQWHLIGQKDAIIPAKLIRKALKKDQNAHIIEYPSFDHHCCWVPFWKFFLKTYLKYPPPT